MPKILKSSQFSIDDANRVSIELTPIEASSLNHLKPEELDIDPEVHAELIIENAKRTADGLIKEARTVSDEIYAQLDEDVRRAKEEGFEQGRAGGYMEGYNDGMAQIEDLRLKAEQTYTMALEERETLLKNIEPEIVDLVEQILGKLISAEIDFNPQVITYLIKNGLTSSAVTGKVKIMVSPDDYDTVRALAQEFEQMLGGSSELDVVRDHSMKKTDCVIETPLGNIDCGLSQQFDSLKRSLYYILNNRSG